jgi:Uma2 family endonuclease
MSLEEFLALPEEKPSLELIDGEVCQKPMGKTDRAIATTNLIRLLLVHPFTRDGRPLAELGLPFPGFMPPNHRVPDLSYFKPGRAIARPYPTEPPDLVVEVRSQGQTLASQRRRLEFLRERGVPATLLIDPEEQRVYLHDGPKAWAASGDDEITIESLGGFSFRVAGLFV